MFLFELLTCNTVLNWKSGRRPDRAATAKSARRRRGSGAGAVGRCRRGVLARRDDDGGVGDSGSGAVWKAIAGGDQMESFDLLTT
jgi:hypothetical protein